jgi:hypothetical protein
VLYAVNTYTRTGTSQIHFVCCVLLTVSLSGMCPGIRHTGPRTVSRTADLQQTSEFKSVQKLIFWLLVGEYKVRVPARFRLPGHVFCGLEAKC